MWSPAARRPEKAESSASGRFGVGVSSKLRARVSDQDRDGTEETGEESRHPAIVSLWDRGLSKLGVVRRLDQSSGG